MTDVPASVETPAVETPAVETPALETPAAAPEWLTDLPDDLKGDATLTRFKDKEALARGFLETQKVARSKFTIPGDGATDEDWGKVYDALGRPENIDGYDVKVVELPADAPDEARAALAEATKPFRELAHRIGLNGSQVSALSEWQVSTVAAERAKGQEEVDAIKTKLGADYEPKRSAAMQVMKQIFGSDDETVAMLNEFDAKLGSGRLVMGMLRLGELAGEAKLIDDDNVDGFGAVENAEAKLEELRGDATWRERRQKGDATVIAQEKRLLALAVRQSQRRG